MFADHEIFECNPAGFPEVETGDVDAGFDDFLSDEEIAAFVASIEVTEIEFDTVELGDDEFVEDVAASAELSAQLQAIFHGTKTLAPVATNNQIGFDF